LAFEQASLLNITHVYADWVVFSEISTKVLIASNLGVLNHAQSRLFLASLKKKIYTAEDLIKNLETFTKELAGINKTIFIEQYVDSIIAGWL
jgi:hypothetical protein